MCLQLRESCTHILDCAFYNPKKLIYGGGMHIIATYLWNMTSRGAGWNITYGYAHDTDENTPETMRHHTKIEALLEGRSCDLRITTRAFYQLSYQCTLRKRDPSIHNGIRTADSACPTVHARQIKHATEVQTWYISTINICHLRFISVISRTHGGSCATYLWK